MAGFFFNEGKRINILTTESEIDNYLETIKFNILSGIRDANSLRKQLNEVKAETYRDEELQKMKTELDEMKDEYYRGFPISKEELDSVHKWQKEHDAAEHSNPNGYHGAIGGGYTYEFIPTSIGTFGTCYCGVCKRKAMIAGATADTPAVKKNGFDRDIYNQYLAEHNGSIDFQEA